MAGGEHFRLDARVARFASAYLAPECRAIAAGGLYDLLPGEPDGLQAPRRWPDPWPGADQPGVFAVCDASGDLLYPGAAGARATARVLPPPTSPDHGAPNRRCLRLPPSSR